MNNRIAFDYEADLAIWNIRRQFSANVPDRPRRGERPGPTRPGVRKTMITPKQRAQLAAMEAAAKEYSDGPVCVEGLRFVRIVGDTLMLSPRQIAMLGRLVERIAIQATTGLLLLEVVERRNRLTGRV